MRLFVAIELPDEVRAAVGRFADEARAALPERALRPVPTENLHLTLLFLGETDEERLPGVVAAIDRASAEAPAVALEAVGSGRFTAAAWVGVTGDVAPLASYVERLHHELGLIPDRPYRPHLTIGRFRDPRRDRRLRLPECGSLGRFEATEAVLVLSELGPGGARYTPLHRSPFRGPVEGTPAPRP